MIRRIVAAAALVACTTGCAAGIYTEIEPLRPAAPLAAERVAVLPLSVDEGAERYRAAIGDALLAAAERAHPWIEFIPPGVTLDRLDEAGVAERLADLLAAYDETGRYDRAVLREVGQALGVDHVLQFQAGYAREREVTTSLLDPGTAYEADRQNLYVTAELWDLRAGELAWEATGTSTTRDAEYERPRSFSEVLAAAAAALAPQIPLRAAGPPADTAPSGAP
jgi:hypothetical protein